MNTGIAGIRNHVMGKVSGLSPVYQGLLLVAVVSCALSVVTSQHKARKLFIELQKEMSLIRTEMNLPRLIASL